MLIPLSLCRQVHRHCSSDDLLNVTLMRVFEKEGSAPIKVDIPLVFMGEDSCPGIRKGEECIRHTIGVHSEYS